MTSAFNPDQASANTGSSIKPPSVPGGVPANIAPTPGKLVARPVSITNTPRAQGSMKAPAPTHVYPVRTGGAGFTQHPIDGIQKSAASTGVPKMNSALKVGKF